MTKINKLGKSTFVIAILSFILVAVLAFGGTYAYFSASSKADTATVTMGHLKISENAKFDTATFTTGKIVVPNQKILNSDPSKVNQEDGEGSGAVTVTVDSNIYYFIRAKIEYSYTIVNSGCTHVENTEAADPCECADRGIELLLIEAALGGDADTAGWISGLKSVSSEQQTAGLKAEVASNNTGWYYYNQAFAPTATGEGKDEGENTPYNRVHTFSVDAQVNPLAGQVESQHFMDATVTIDVTFEVIQADYIVDDGSSMAKEEIFDAAELQAAWNKAKTPIPTEPADPEG